MIRYRLQMVVPWLIAGATILACARHRATLGPGAPLALGALITVIQPDQDPADVQSQLTTLLQQRGFRVVSGTKGSAIPIGKSAGSRDTANTRGTLPGGGVQLVGSDYALSYSYVPLSGVGTMDMFQSFAATIVDLRTGALVAAAVPELRELNGKRIAAVLMRFVDDIPTAKK